MVDRRVEMPQHGLIDMGVELGYPRERVAAVFGFLVDKYARGDVSKLGASHQDEFFDKLLGGEELPAMRQVPFGRSDPSSLDHLASKHLDHRMQNPTTELFQRCIIPS